MKTLQNNFTTPEQSKRLLKLGVPEWTADCVLRHYNWAENNLNENNWEYPCVQAFGYEGDLDRFLDDEYDNVLPCWSVGRLQEIFAICYTGELFQMWCDSGFYLTDNIIEGMELRINEMDFSKLEE